MFYRSIFGIFSILLLQSCDLVAPNKSSSLKLIASDTLIDITSVDVYPLFAVCEGFDSSTQNYCFENTFKSTLEDHLNDEKLESYEVFTDTVFAKILIDSQGKMSVSNLKMSDLVIEEIPEFDSIFRANVKKMPPVLQASTKRGIPVNAQFNLPIVIKVRQ